MRKLIAFLSFCAIALSAGAQQSLTITHLSETHSMVQLGGKDRMARGAYEVGFSSPSYFSKCYRELFGSLPTENR